MNVSSSFSSSMCDGIVSIVVSMTDDFPLCGLPDSSVFAINASISLASSMRSSPPVSFRLFDGAGLGLLVGSQLMCRSFAGVAMLADICFAAFIADLRLSITSLEDRSSALLLD